MDCDSSANVVTVDKHSTGFAPRVGRKEGQSQASLWRDKITLHYHDMPAHIYRRDLVEGSVKMPPLYIGGI